MVENSKELNTEVEAKADIRGVWSRPVFRALDADGAETQASGSNTDIVFS